MIFASLVAFAMAFAAHASYLAGSVSGQVELANGAPLPPGCIVRLGPPVAAVPDRADTAERLERLARVTRPNEQGFFQFSGLAPGTYTLRAELKGYAPSETALVVVRAGLPEVLKTPLTLRIPATLRVQVDPPLDPFDRPWRLRLDRESASGGGERQGVADDSGAWEARWLPPGRWHVRVLGDHEGIWADQIVEMNDTDQFASVEIEAVAVEGRALQGDEPFRGALWFGGTNGPRRVKFQPDENGEFLGLLPSEGDWEVQAEDRSAGLHRLAIEPVTVRRRPGQSKARVEIRVPDTRLEGRVVDESGTGVPASLTLITDHSVSLARTEGDGRFLLRGLAAENLSIKAESDDRESEVQRVLLDEESTGPELTIVVHRRMRIRGVVRSAIGPVPGAEIFLWPPVEMGGLSSMERAVSGPDGAFEAALPGSSRTVDMIVSAPGYGVSLSRRSIPDDGSLTIALGEAIGTLEIELPQGSQAPLSQSLLAHGGAFVPILFLDRWGTFDAASRRLALPAVEAGEWTLCNSVADFRAATGAGGCAQGVLSPGSRLSLQTGDPGH